MHGVRDTLMHQIHHEIPRSRDVSRRVLHRAIGFVSRSKSHEWRAVSEDVEEAVRGSVDGAVRIQRGDPSDWSWDDQSRKQLVTGSLCQRLHVDVHVGNNATWSWNEKGFGARLILIG